jgi:diguanylate cyclase (GGDEF)-like protein
MKNSKSVNPVIFLITFFIIIFAISLSANDYAQIIANGKPIALNDGWILVSDENQDLELESLPVDLNTPRNEIITIKNTLDDSFTQSQTLLIRTSLQEIEVYLDGVSIYERNFDDSNTKTYASLWHKVSIPENSNGSDIEITLVSPFKSMSGVVNSINYGSEAELKDFLFAEYGFRLVISSFVFIISLFMLITSCIFFKKQNYQNGYLALFGMFLSLWIFAESRLVQFFSANTFFIGSLAYLSSALMPIPIIIYVKLYLTRDYQKFYNYFCIVSAVNFVLVLFFELTGILRFFQSVIISQIIIFIGLTISLYLLFLQYKKYQDKKVKLFLIAFSFLFIFVALEMINFIIGNFELTSIFALIALALIIATMFFFYLGYLVKRLKISYEKEIYQKLAYTDQLTEAKNRFAFEEDLDNLFAKENKDFRLIYLDFNDLKRINDTFGHLEGDKVLQNGYQIMNLTFGTKGTVYRVGGDEFACVIETADKLLYETLLNDFNAKLENFNNNNDYKITISLGSALFDNLIDSKPSDMIKRADENMYSDKSKKKSRQTA